jgi:hypothetical protein
MTYLTELGLLGNTVGLVISGGLTFIFAVWTYGGISGLKFQKDEYLRAIEQTSRDIDRDFEENKFGEATKADVEALKELTARNLKKDQIYTDSYGEENVYRSPYKSLWGWILFFSALSFIGGFGSLFFAVKLVKSIWEL